MPLVSSYDAVRQGKISVLAIVETIVASGLSFWLAWHRNSIEHIVIASALSPFLLLRTQQSTKLTLDSLSRISQKLPEAVVELFFVPIIKLVCMIVSVFSHPVDHVLSIPHNFYKYVFTVDFLRSPQVIPEADQIADGIHNVVFVNEVNEIYNIPKLLLEIAKEHTYKSIVTHIIGLVCLGLVLSPLIILSFSFRFAVKSTALIWLPLLYIIYQSRSGQKLIDRVDYQLHAPWTITMLTYSCFVLMASGLKVALYIGVWKLVKLDDLGRV